MYSDTAAYLLRQLHDTVVPSEKLVRDFRSNIALDEKRGNSIHDEDAKRLHGDHPKESALHRAHEAVVAPDVRRDTRRKGPRHAVQFCPEKGRF